MHKDNATGNVWNPFRIQLHQRNFGVKLGLGTFQEMAAAARSAHIGDVGQGRAEFFESKCLLDLAMDKELRHNVALKPTAATTTHEFVGEQAKHTVWPL